jgi:hypothetical protein
MSEDFNIEKTEGGFEVKPMEENSSFTESTWKEIKPFPMKTFQLGDEPEVIHIIKTGFPNLYILTWEDAYEMMLGKIELLSKEEIETKFKITL